MEFSRTDIRKLIFYNWNRGMNAPAIAKEICVILGEGTVEDDLRDGRPSMEDLDDQIEEAVAENNQATTREMAISLNVDRSTIWRHRISLATNKTHDNRYNRL